ncbi:MAG TPA: hypothetical protein V6D14_30195 [Coleofasciculaceae cyanobacterium]
MTQKLQSPQLTLFAFHLLHEMTQDFQEAAKEGDVLWRRCASLGQELGISQLETLPEMLKTADTSFASQQPYVELLQPQRFLSFQADSGLKHPYLAATVYPVQLHDTYALDLTLHYVDEDTVVEVKDLSQLNPNGCLLPRHIQPTLGQTLVLLAEPTQIPCDYKALADECVEALLEGVDYPALNLKSTTNEQPPYLSCVAEGELFSSPIFEYEVIGGVQNPLAQCHILVWLNVYPEKTLPLAQKAEPWLLRLLCYRSKILYAVHGAQVCSDRARTLYNQLEKKTHVFSNLSSQSAKQLEELKALVNDAPPIAFEFSRYLRDIKDHGTTINANAENYAASLAKIRALSLTGDELGFWQDFYDRKCKQFQEQIQVDLKYYEPGMNLFEQMISTIRARVEIELAERDRSLERTIQILAIGLGAGGLVASSSGQIDKPFLLPFSTNIPHPVILTFFLSVVTALIFGGMTWWITRVEK